MQHWELLSHFVPPSYPMHWALCRPCKSTSSCLPAGHIIGGVVGGVIGGILLCCVLPCVCVCCVVYWTNRQRVRPVNTTVTTHPVQPTTYPLQTAPYQPYVPPPVVQTSNVANQPVSDFVSHQPEPQPSAPPQLPNAQLFNAEPPPPYPATGYATVPAPPQAPAPGDDVAYERKATDFPGHDT